RTANSTLLATVTPAKSATTMTLPLHFLVHIELSPFVLNTGCVPGRGETKSLQIERLHYENQTVNLEWRFEIGPCRSRKHLAAPSSYKELTSSAFPCRVTRASTFRSAKRATHRQATFRRQLVRRA